MTDTRALDDEGSVPGPVAVESPLRNPAFRNLWFNSITFFLVSNAQRFVVGWYVLDDEIGGLDRGEGGQAIAVFALGIPALFLVLQAGAWADRLDRRLLLGFSQLGSMLPLAAMALLSHQGRLTWTWVLVLAVLAGAASALGQPVRAALLPALVRPEQLFSAIAINALAITASLVIGPALAEWVGDQIGFTGTFLIMAGVLAVGMAFVIPLTIPERAVATEKRPLRHEMADAVRHVLHDPALRVLFGLLTVASVTVNPAVMVTLQAFVKEELGRSAGDAGRLFALMGLGIAITSFVLMRKGHMKNKGAAFQRALMVGSTMTFLMGRATSYGQLVVLVFFMGLAGGFYINMNQGLIQGNTPEALMGRVMALFTLVQAGLLPLGALAIGVVAERIGIGNTMSIVAAIGFAAVTTTYITQRELRSLS